MSEYFWDQALLIFYKQQEKSWAQPPLQVGLVEEGTRKSEWDRGDEGLRVVRFPLAGDGGWGHLWGVAAM